MRRLDVRDGWSRRSRVTTCMQSHQEGDQGSVRQDPGASRQNRRRSGTGVKACNIISVYHNNEVRRP